MRGYGPRVVAAARYPGLAARLWPCALRNVTSDINIGRFEIAKCLELELLTGESPTVMSPSVVHHFAHFVEGKAI